MTKPKKNRPPPSVTREALVEVIRTTAGDEFVWIRTLADAILSAFGLKLRRQLSREEWATWLRSFGVVNDLYAADRLLAKLAELEQPVELDARELERRMEATESDFTVAAEQWGLSPQGRRERHARAAIAYFKEKLANVTTKPDTYTVHNIVNRKKWSHIDKEASK